MLFRSISQKFVKIKSIKKWINSDNIRRARNALAYLSSPPTVKCHKKSFKINLYKVSMGDEMNRMHELKVGR